MKRAKILPDLLRKKLWNTTKLFTCPKVREGENEATDDHPLIHPSSILSSVLVLLFYTAVVHLHWAAPSHCVWPDCPGGSPPGVAACRQSELILKHQPKSMISTVCLVPTPVLKLLLCQPSEFFLKNTPLQLKMAFSKLCAGGQIVPEEHFQSNGNDLQGRIAI